MVVTQKYRFDHSADWLSSAIGGLFISWFFSSILFPLLIIALTGGFSYDIIAIFYAPIMFFAFSMLGVISIGIPVISLYAFLADIFRLPDFFGRIYPIFSALFLAVCGYSVMWVLFGQDAPITEFGFGLIPAGYGLISGLVYSLLLSKRAKLRQQSLTEKRYA